MEQKETLTNEEISKKFNNQFDLVNYAIKAAVDMIQTGRAPRTTLHSENPALQVLEEILTGTDKLKESSEKAPVQYHNLVEVEEVVTEIVEVIEEVETATPE